MPAFVLRVPPVPPAEMSEAAMDRLDVLEGKYPATTFTVLHVRWDGSALIEHEDLQGSGHVLLTAAGEVRIPPAALVALHVR